MEKYQSKIPIFDWRCDGVTTISCDTHKFGYATKGTSVLMFRSAEIRRFAYFLCNQSTIGLYCTPTIQGSRNGAVIACAWSVMMKLGKNGYIEEATKIMNATDYIKYEIINNNKINKYIKIMGEPLMSVVAWRLTPTIKKRIDGIHVYQISDAMKKYGWSLNNCKDPACTHMCVTAINSNGARKFIDNLIDAIDDVVNNNHKYKKTSGALYGAMVEMGEKQAKDDYMRTYLDVISDLPSKL